MTDLDFWHKRYQEQANWTRELRQNLFGKFELPQNSKILEVGCGTGVIIAEIDQQVHPHLAVGLDLDLKTISFAKSQQNTIKYLSGNGLSLPFPDSCFNVAYVHYVLLWINDPVQMIKEMVRVTKKGGLIAAFAEPDYGGRIDYPESLEPAGKEQTRSLTVRGIDPFCGRKIASIFHDAGLSTISAGIYGSQWHSHSERIKSTELEVMKADLNVFSGQTTIDQQMDLDQKYSALGTRVLFVPTFYAYGLVE